MIIENPATNTEFKGNPCIPEIKPMSRGPIKVFKNLLLIQPQYPRLFSGPIPKTAYAKLKLSFICGVLTANFQI